MALLFAALAGAAQGTVAALLFAHLIGTSTQYFRPEDGGVHGEDIVIGAITGAIVGGLLASRGHHARVYIFSLWSRVAVLGSAWPFVRFGLEQPDSISTAVFGLLGVWLAVVGAAWIVSDVRFSSAGAGPKSKWARLPIYLSYGSASLAVVVMGIFLTGTRELHFQRDEGSEVSMRMVTYRWLGRTQTESKRATGVTAWRPDDGANAVELVAASGVVRVGGNRSITKDLTALVDKSLNRFLESNRKQLTLTEATPRWSFRFYLFGAALVLLYGSSIDPLVEPDPIPLLAAWSFAGITGLAALASMLSMTNQFQEELAGAEELLRQTGGTVQRTQLRAGNDVFYADGFQVQFTDSSFGDSELMSIVPELDLIGVSLNLSGTAVTDVAVGKLKHYKHVLMLDLRGTAVTNELLVDLRNANLRYLDVRDTAIDGQGLKHLKGMRLRYLYFSDPDFGDRDLEILYDISGLEYAYIGGSRVTEAGLEEWSEVLPGVEIGP